MSLKLPLRRWLPLLLILVGVVVVAYVASQYWTMYSEQRRLARQWETQNLHTTAAAPVDDGLTKMVIPKINLDAIVVEGTSNRDLLLGPGHLKNTPQPGESGNSVITAHRDTFFRHIYELSKGDHVEVRRQGKLFRYQVTGKKIVKPTDLSVLRQGGDKRLTLITCYPTYFIGPAPERLVVFTRLIEEPEQAGAPQAVSAATGGNH